MNWLFVPPSSFTWRAAENEVISFRKLLRRTTISVSVRFAASAVV